MDIESSNMCENTRVCLNPQLKITAKVFSLKSTPSNMWVMWVYIVWVKTWCSRYAKIAKQNVSWISRGKALLAKYSWKPAVMTLHISVMCSACGSLHGKDSREIPAKFTLSSIATWVFTLSLTHNSYNKIPHKIQSTYDWTKI